jgi:hypothetical protein
MTAGTADAAGSGRGGRMSRRRKRAAVLRLLRGEDLETVSRALGVTAAPLSGLRDAFLAAGEASLATRPSGGEVLESERRKARLEGGGSSVSCWRPRSRPLRAAALWSGEGQGHEPDHLARQRQAPWSGPAVPDLASIAGDRLLPSPAAPAIWADRELPPWHAGADGDRPRCAPCAEPAADHCPHLRLGADRPVAPQAALRFPGGDAFGLRGHEMASRTGSRRCRLCRWPAVWRGSTAQSALPRRCVSRSAPGWAGC